MQRKINLIQVICLWMGKTTKAKPLRVNLRSPFSRIHYYQSKRLQVKESQYLIPTYSWTLTNGENKLPTKLNATKNKFDIGDLFTNVENHWGKTPPGEFKVTTPENPLLSKQVVTSKGLSLPYTNLELNPYPNTQLDLFCSDNLSF